MAKTGRLQGGSARGSLEAEKEFKAHVRNDVVLLFDRVRTDSRSRIYGCPTHDGGV